MCEFPGSELIKFLFSDCVQSVLDRSAHCINMGSYNYLGFAENTGPRSVKVQESVSKYGSSIGTTRHECGQ